MTPSREETLRQIRQGAEHQLGWALEEDLAAEVRGRVEPAPVAPPSDRLQPADRGVDGARPLVEVCSSEGVARLAEELRPDADEADRRGNCS